MPYIKQEERPKIDKAVDELARTVYTSIILESWFEDEHGNRDR